MPALEIKASATPNATKYIATISKYANAKSCKAETQFTAE